MTREERNNWLINIENTASFIASEIGDETVNFVFEKYGAKSVERIASSDYRRFSASFTQLKLICDLIDRKNTDKNRLVRQGLQNIPGNIGGKSENDWSSYLDR